MQLDAAECAARTRVLLAAIGATVDSVVPLPRTHALWDAVSRATKSAMTGARLMAVYEKIKAAKAAKAASKPTAGAGAGASSLQAGEGASSLRGVASSAGAGASSLRGSGGGDGGAEHPPPPPPLQQQQQQQRSGSHPLMRHKQQNAGAR